MPDDIPLLYNAGHRIRRLKLCGSPVYEPSTPTPKYVRIGSMGEPMVTVLLPAKRRATGLLLWLLFLPLPSTTMSDPESPPALKPPGDMMTCSR